MVFEEIPVDIRAIFLVFLLYSTSLWASGIQKKYQKITRMSTRISLKKHDITVLSSDYTNLVSSTLLILRLEKEKLQKWILTRKCSIAAESHIRSHYHISSKIQLFW